MPQYVRGGAASDFFFEYGLAELRHAELISNLIQVSRQGRRDRNPVFRARQPGFVAALARNRNPLYAGHSLAGPDIAHQRIDIGLEGRNVDEGADVDGGDRLPGIVTLSSS